MKKIKFSIGSFSRHKIQKIAWSWWVMSFRYVMLALTISALIFVGRIWYINVYALNIAPEEEQREIQLRQDAVQFDKEEFIRVVEIRDQRSKEFLSQNDQVEDIFYPNGAPVIQVGDDNL